jgi:membrane protein DedA with SNARE-associated domain
MDSLADLFSQHALWAVFLTVLLEQLGLPIPSTPVLLLAGARLAGMAGFMTL